MEKTGLQGSADEDGNGEIRVSETGEYVTDEMPKLARRLVQEPINQKPAGYSRGEEFPLARLQEIEMVENLREDTNAPGRRCGSEHPIAAIGLWYMMSFAVAQAAWAGSPILEAAPSGVAGAPLVVHADYWEPPVAMTETVVLALRILRRSGVKVRLDTPQASELAHEIERVLSRIRDTHPVIKDVTVRENFDPWSLILHLEPDLNGKVSRVVSLLDDESESVPLRTGHEQFDTLNTKYGLAAIEPYYSLSVAIFYFNKPIHPLLSLLDYVAIEGVESAELNARVGDGPDIEVSRSQGTWYVVFRKAWGDCPSGCIDSELFFFTVQEDEIERFEFVQAMDIPMFAELVERRGWP